MEIGKLRWAVAKRVASVLSIIILFMLLGMVFTSDVRAQTSEISDFSLPQLSTEINYCRCNYENYRVDIRNLCDGQDFMYTGVFYSNSGSCTEKSSCYAPQNRSPVWVDCCDCGSTMFGTGIYGDTLQWRIEDKCIGMPSLPNTYTPNWD